MTRAALLLGGNQGDRLALIAEATEQIGKRIGSVAAASSIYETAPWGDFGDERPQDFMNQALLVDTELTAEHLLDAALAIESELGRRRVAGPRQHYSSRPMDIDIIFYGDAVIATERLSVPHPRMQERLFVLEPLAEVMADYRHPQLKKSVGELLNDLRRREGIDC